MTNRNNRSERYWQAKQEQVVSGGIPTNPEGERATRFPKRVFTYHMQPIVNGVAGKWEEKQFIAYPSPRRVVARSVGPSLAEVREIDREWAETKENMRRDSLGFWGRLREDLFGRKEG